MWGRKAKLFLAQSIFWTFAICSTHSGISQQTNDQNVSTTVTQSQNAKTDSSEVIEKDGIYEVGGEVLPPKLIKAPMPGYTDAARKFHIEGECTVSLVVDAAGKPQNVVVEKKIGLGLDENALRAVKKYRFQPATLNGKPVPVKINVIVDFLICESKEDCQQKQASLSAGHKMEHPAGTSNK